MFKRTRILTRLSFALLFCCLTSQGEAVKLINDLRNNKETPLLIRKHPAIMPESLTQQEFNSVALSYTLGLCSKADNYTRFYRVIANGTLAFGTSATIPLKTLKKYEDDDKVAVEVAISDQYTADTLFTFWEEGIKQERSRIFYIGSDDKGLQDDSTLVFYAQPHTRNKTLEIDQGPSNEMVYSLRCRIKANLTSESFAHDGMKDKGR